MSILQQVQVKNGQEGPAHDPYSYTELTWRGDGKTVILHQGLGNWVKVNGIEQRFSGEEYETMPQQVWEEKTGIKVDDVFKEFYEEKFCTSCGPDEDAEWKSGMPGESFLTCKGCGEVIDTSFNESAIM